MLEDYYEFGGCVLKAEGWIKDYFGPWLDWVGIRDFVEFRDSIGIQDSIEPQN